MDEFFMTVLHDYDLRMTDILMTGMQLTRCGSFVMLVSINSELI